MPVLRALARPMVAAVFVVQGFDTVLHPGKYAESAAPVVKPITSLVPQLPDQTEQAVRLNGAVQLAAGALLAIGRFPRLSAFALAATLVPTTLAGHRYWEAQDKQEKAEQRTHLLKNASMLGGLLIAGADTAGKPSLAWRGRHAAKTAKHDAKLVRKTAKASSKAGARASRVTSHLPG